ncbi:MAG: hypothetical protein NZ108_09660, partial [Bacteroidia bacterium]|nr:hypothetical protein [Bacteroidia bacterium]
GAYTVEVIGTGNCSDTSSAVNVTVNTSLTAVITPASQTTFCNPGSVVLNANTGTGYSYIWTKNGMEMNRDSLCYFRFESNTNDTLNRGLVTFVNGSGVTPDYFAGKTGTAVRMSNSSGNFTRYYQFNVNATNYSALKLSFWTQRSNTGAQQVRVTYSTNGDTGPFQIAGQTSVPASPASIDFELDLSNIGTYNGQSNLVFRLEVGGASGTGTIRFDDFVITGVPNVSSITADESGSYRVRIFNDAGCDVTSAPVVVNETNGSPVLSNDAVCGAIPFSYSNGVACLATTNVNAVPTCSGALASCQLLNDLDVWYRVAIPASGSVIISGFAGTLLDGVIAVYTGTNCGSLTQVACADNDGMNLWPSISLSGLTPNTPVWIRVWGKNGTSGTFTLTATDPIANTFTWTGAVSTDWNNPANWSACNVPNAFSNVTIPTVTNKPIISGNAMTRNLTILNNPSGNTLTI